jgi:hypothetical protein
MNTIFSTSFTRFARGLATISIIPALFLPFYQAFLHGGMQLLGWRLPGALF